MDYQPEFLFDQISFQLNRKLWHGVQTITSDKEGAASHPCWH